MAESEFYKILDMFDKYISLIESPEISGKVTPENITKLFDCCRFVEAAVAKAQQEDKTECLESHLKFRWSQNKRTVTYAISEFEKASDKMLEVFLKDPAISTLVIDKLLELYTRYFGSERLNNLLGTLLTDSMCTNVIVESLVKLGVSESEIEDEALLATWENEAARGKHQEVSQCIKEMLKNDKLLTIVRFASQIRDDSPLKKLIMQSLTTEAFDNKPTFYATLAQIDKKLLYKLLRDGNFQKDFLDGVFYFARNMELRDDSWYCEHEFTYDLLVRTMRTLLRASDDVFEATKYLLEYVKNQPGSSSIWNDVHRDSLR